MNILTTLARANGGAKVDKSLVDQLLGRSSKPLSISASPENHRADSATFASQSSLFLEQIEKMKDKEKSEGR